MVDHVSKQLVADKFGSSVSVVYIYGLSLPNKTANAVAVIGLASALQAMNYAVTLLHPDGSGSSVDTIRQTYAVHPDLRLQAIAVPRGSRRNLVLARSASKSGLKNAVLITRIPQVAVVAAASGRRVILELHQDAATNKNWKIWRLGLHLVKNDRLRIITLTQSVCDHLDPLLRKKAGAPTISASATRDLTPPDNIPAPYDVGFVGSFIPGKGVDFIERLVTIAPRYRFVLYGDHGKDPAVAARLRKLPNVTLGGFVKSSEIATALASFTVGLAPYSVDGFGAWGSAFVRADSLSSLKIVEYMAARRVILASRIPAVQAMVDDGHNGLLCTPDDPADWKNALDRVFNNEALRTGLAANAYAAYRRSFSFEVRAACFGQVIDELNAAGA